jgi:hypothetical protein
MEPCHLHASLQPPQFGRDSDEGTVIERPSRFVGPVGQCPLFTPKLSSLGGDKTSAFDPIADFESVEHLLAWLRSLC